ncbi:MAG: hypothetical protein ABSC47_08965 [Terracidiphilus sp.]|jgi:hypothetical protein
MAIEITNVEWEEIEERLGGVMTGILRDRILELERQLADLQRRFDLLADPHAVYINILRGTLPLTKDQAIHIAGLPADIKEQLDRLRALEDKP